jgi:NADPH:quinone reductase-like Zn-dependent oxidoreductase
VLAARELDPAVLAADIIDAIGAVDVVIELVGGDYLVTDLAVTGPLGRIVLVGMMAGTRTQVDLGAMLVKRLRIYGTTLRGRSVEEKAAATAAFTRDVVPLLVSGTVQPVIARTMPLEEGPDAYELQASDAVFGGIVLDAT